MRSGIGYSKTEIDAMVAILRRAAPACAIDEDALVAEILNIMTAIGLARLTEYDRAFAEHVKVAAFQAALGRRPNDPEELASSASKIVPTKIAAARARLYDRIAKADMAGLPAAVAAAIHHDRVVLTELRVATGRQQPRSRSVSLGSIASLSDLANCGLPADPDSIRGAAERLALANRSWVKAGQSRKAMQWTALPLLADTFLRFTGSSESPLSLPHSASSRFIKFATLALQPFVQQTEASHGALGKSWERVKAHELAPALDVEPDTATVS